jgi:membrane-bound lytic murein transglycosylase B
MQRRTFCTALVAVTAFAPTAGAQDAAFQTYLRGVRAEAQGKGVSSATLDRALTGIEQQPRVLELFSKQPEFKLSFQQYLDIVVTEQRVRRGRELLREHRTLIERFAALNGLPPSLIVALWGIESNFGERLGDFPVVASLATLAFNGKRAQFFRGELISALRILDQGHIDPAAMKGSWAGAMGQCQFIPSSFLAYGADGDGDGRKDIWGNRADVFASIGNYMRRVGWKAGETWGREVDGQAGAPQGGRIVRPAGPGGPTYATTRNFAAILRWNQSDFFALAVGLLSDRIAAR